MQGKIQDWIRGWRELDPIKNREQVVLQGPSVPIAKPIGTTPINGAYDADAQVEAKYRKMITPRPSQSIDVAKVYPGAPIADPTNLAPRPRSLRKSALIETNKPLIDPFHNPIRGGALLNNNSAVAIYNTNYQPDYWVIHARLTAGYLWIYPGSAASGQMYRLDSGVMEIPLNDVDTMSVETVGASGWYSLYAVREPESTPGAFGIFQ